MHILKSPLNITEFNKIKDFFKENKELMILSENYSDLNDFIEKIPEFNELIRNLNDVEKNKAWFYLYDLAKNESFGKTESDSIRKKESWFNSGKIQFFIGIGFISIILLIIFSYLKNWDSGKTATKLSQYDQCVVQGIQYYKDIGSYPMLKTENISADLKVQKNCMNSVVAFGSVN
ncbi:hypothetical protein [Acinetobacter piscicola]|uniref:hypothetical protein n=1 Tax=Acinetobacter piscicola TaxID=2006115 RepID=UPI001E50565B|nr:hypothetical protein [Acinetobacter piscicola]